MKKFRDAFIYGLGASLSFWLVTLVFSLLNLAIGGLY